VAYEPFIEHSMKQFYETLSEKDQRRYAAIEALKLGHGGLVYMAQVLGCCRQRIAQGIGDLQSLPEEEVLGMRTRKPGGGRKPYDETYPDLDQAFFAVLKDHTAGDPMDAQVVWTDLTQQEIADRLSAMPGIQVSRTVVRQLLRKHQYRARKMQKKRP
jgi:hypothetical protein